MLINDNLEWCLKDVGESGLKGSQHKCMLTHTHTRTQTHTCAHTLTYACESETTWGLSPQWTFLTLSPVNRGVSCRMVRRAERCVTGYKIHRSPVSQPFWKVYVVINCLTDINKLLVLHRKILYIDEHNFELPSCEWWMQNFSGMALTLSL